MPGRWFQFRLKTLLAIVTLVGVSLWLILRVQYCRKMAQHHGLHYVMHMLPIYPDPSDDDADNEQRRRGEARRAKLADHHRRMADRYRRAMWFPLLPVPAEPLPTPSEDGKRVGKSNGPGG
jgi:hypothetical protein